MRDPQAATDLIAYIRQHLLTSVMVPPHQQTTHDLWIFRSHLHAVQHFCRQAETEITFTLLIDNLLSTSADYWRLIAENRSTVTNLKEYTRVRTLSAEAEGLVNLEELISGEDTLRDVIINSVAFFLNWKSNTIWVDSAKRSQRELAQNFMIEIQDRIWQFIQESAGTVENPDLDRVGQIRRRADGFMRLIQNEQLSTEGQILILLQIYQLLLQLQLGKLLLQLETVSSNQPTEAITENESG